MKETQKILEGIYCDIEVEFKKLFIKNSINVSLLFLNDYYKFHQKVIYHLSISLNNKLDERD